MPKATRPDLLELAFALAAERSWREFSFAELARRAGVDLAHIYAELPDRAALVRVLGRRLDAEMLRIDLAELDGMTPRERVFELVMRRLDAMAPYKDGLRALARESAREPMFMLAACCNVDRLSRRLLDAAATGKGLAARRIARHLIAVVYVRAFKVWLDDDTADMARTLAELDRRLQQGESVARLLGRLCPVRREASAAAAG